MKTIWNFLAFRNIFTKLLPNQLMVIAFILLIYLLGCSSSSDCTDPECDEEMTPAVVQPTPVSGAAIIKAFNGRIDPANLLNYANQEVPAYITQDNGKENPITDEGATLGRVLFYDKMLSIDNTISCASCHQQEFAFSDPEKLSKGVEGGITGRHSMRLVNARFGAEKRFFWDERAESLEAQTTMPIRDHAELGFSGENGRPGMQDLMSRLAATDYYQELFTMVYGDAKVTEERMQLALAQFVRSIQSFDSKYDEGYNSDFSNFTESEKRGHQLFTTDVFGANLQRTGGGLDCFKCHRPPEFDINPLSGNNGLIAVANAPGEVDLTNTRAPSLRNLTNPEGILNGPLMHDGSITSLETLVDAVGNNDGDPRNTRLDPIIPPGGTLNITFQESSDLIAFLKTLSGRDVYTNEKWSNPFTE